MSPLRGLGYVYAIFFYRDVTPTGFGFVYDYRSTEMSPPTGQGYVYATFFCGLLLVFI